MSQPDQPATAADTTDTPSYPVRIANAVYDGVTTAAQDTYDGAVARVEQGYRGLCARLRDPDPTGRTDFFDDPTRLLLLAMGLPLVDGVFPSIVLSGTLASLGALLVTGATIFGGPWALTIVIGEMAGDDIRVRLRRLLTVGGLVIPGAGVVAVLAPTLASLLHMPVFHVFSAAVILTVAAMIANDGLAERLPAPKWVVGAGLAVSVGANLATGSGITPAFELDPMLVARALAAAGIAFTIAGVAAFTGPTLDEWLDLDRFSVGSGISLALIPFSIFGVLPGLASLAVFGLAVVVALDP